MAGMEKTFTTYKQFTYFSALYFSHVSNSCLENLHLLTGKEKHFPQTNWMIIDQTLPSKQFDTKLREYDNLYLQATDAGSGTRAWGTVWQLTKSQSNSLPKSHGPLLQNVFPSKNPPRTYISLNMTKVCGSARPIMDGVGFPNTRRQVSTCKGNDKKKLGTLKSFY